MATKMAWHLCFLRKDHFGQLKWYVSHDRQSPQGFSYVVEWPPRSALMATEIWTVSSEDFVGLGMRAKIPQVKTSLPCIVGHMILCHNISQTFWALEFLSILRGKIKTQVGSNSIVGSTLEVMDKWKLHWDTRSAKVWRSIAINSRWMVGISFPAAKPLLGCLLSQLGASPSKVPSH